MIKLAKGNTQKGVSEFVFKTIHSLFNNKSNGVFLDIPCGDGAFAKLVKQQFPQVRVIGVDKFGRAEISPVELHVSDVHQFLQSTDLVNVNVITCISGVMCFDGLEALLARFHMVLKDGGTLVLTNDNILTVRDRLHFLFFGHFKRFKLLFDTHEGNWNLVLPQALYSHFEKAKFKNIKIIYTSAYIEDLMLIPLAMIIYVIFLPYLCFFKSPLPFQTRLILFPFKMLISRHYVMVAEK